ncbi:unnamed protein product [Adineta steineri]|uniref:Glycosyltransferase 61 catalytic domain-containing protein n=1 Tax=Adineta steineri TaxID=433720 RepID=A0A818UB62_9BILA|nr:unnamed protein product [Adineta steineri]
MTEVLIEREPNNRPNGLHQNKIYFAIIFVTIAVIITSLSFKSSYNSYLPFLPKARIDNDTPIVSCSQKDYVIKNEIAIPYFSQDVGQYFSKFQCTGSENNIEEWEERLCIFYNTCYNVDTGRFHYFRTTQRKSKPIFYDSKRRMIYEFGNKDGINNFVSLASRGSAPWSPISVSEPYPSKNFTRLHDLHNLMQSTFASDNIAHGLWEDLGSISYSLDRMSITDPNLVIMHLNNIPKTPLFKTYHQYVIPALTKNPMVEFGTYVKSFHTKHVCFDRLIVGGQLSVFPKPRIKENHGREALFYNWRSKIIKYNGFDPNFVPQKHHIIITNKSVSAWTRPNSKLHRAIFNLEEVEKFIKLTYPTISVDVVEWHTIPFNKQIEKLLNTTILITPCGGVSLILPLLPNGAHAIVMDYYATVAVHGFSIGESGSMEGALLNHIAHVRKQYYQIYGKQDYEFDFPGATDAREASSIIVNMTRLQLLIDKALEEMEP